MDRLSIGIIGGGIGGASAALQLRQAGFEVDVFEKFDHVQEVGAGINISPNAANILHRLGLAEDLASLGVIPEAWHQRRWDSGETLQWAPLAGPVAAAFGAPQYQMHRSDLLELLSSKIEPGRLHVGKELVQLEEAADHVVAVFADGTKNQFDMVVGADGIHSRTREILFGSLPATFKNCIAYRGLIPSDKVEHLSIPTEAQIWMGPGRHFVHYYVRNGELLNFVANVDQAVLQDESWTNVGDVYQLRSEFSGWHSQVVGILEAVSETFTLALHDRAPLKRWSKGRITLLGDACHPMEPHLAQGAAQAIEDGAALTSILASGIENIELALNKYEELRLPRTSLIQSMADQNRKNFHLQDGPDQKARDAKLARGEAGFDLSRIGWLYGHDATNLDFEGVSSHSDP